MEITLERSEEISEHLKGIVEHLNGISEEEFEALIEIGRRKEALDPLIDPTGWRDVYGKANLQTTKVLHSLLDFKRAVKGIGHFK